MTIKIRGKSILDYKHSRDVNYKTTVDELFKLINDFTNQKELNDFYNYFEKKYQLPLSVIKQSLSQYIANSYEYRSGKFNSKLRLKNIPKSILYYGSLIYSLLFVNIKKKKTKKFYLIIDLVTSQIEMKRWEKLLNLIGSSNVICITRDINLNKDFPKYNLYNKRRLRNINLLDLLKSIFNEFSSGIWIVLKVSLKIRVNLLLISLKIILDNLIFKSIFAHNKAKYIIQEKHYQSEPIKNYLFKKSGGIASSSIQKNIIQSDPIFFYVDLDILFSLGQEGFERLYEYGGRIDNIRPVGSLFMEYLWFDTKKNINKKYDIAILGINVSNAIKRLDSYDQFKSDYYSLYRWAAKLSIDNPKYNIVLVHHSSAGKDIIENEILLGSNIKVLDKNINSYEIAFSSKIALTYGSTMGYELNAHKLTTFFIDPGYRCSFLPDKGFNYLDSFRLKSYNSFKMSVKKIIDNEETIDLEKKFSDKLCLDSSNVSYNIYKNFNLLEKK